MQTFTVRISSTFLLALLSQLAFAQFSDDFSDGNFNELPTWSGTDQLFKATDSRLMLNGGERDSVAYLATPCNISSPGSWEFDFSFRFNPSGANYAKAYLISNQADLTAPLNGYFVSLGRNNDAISLYKQNGLTVSEIVLGRNDILNQSSLDARVKVTRDDSGWKLFTDLNGNGLFSLEGTSNDSAPVESSYFGIVCVYTSTRSDKFYFDNFNVSARFAIDVVPPALTKIEVVSSKEVKLIFSEPLDDESASNVNNYFIDEAQHPTHAILASDQRSVLLVLEGELSAQVHTVTISALADLNANQIDMVHSEFSYVPPLVAEPDEVIISEIFPDPSPQVGLAEVEFVEIYNRSNKTFDLDGWSLTDGSSVATLPTYMLMPGAFLVLVPENTSEYFENALSLKDFPSLNNTGDALMLTDNNSQIVDSVNYDQSWYRNSEKEDGGWSLEIIDPNNLCGEHQNWASSEDVRGGTPGFMNSVLASKPDLSGPKLVAAIAVDSVTLRLRFDEKLERPIPSDLHVETEPHLDIGVFKFSNLALTEIEVSDLTEIQKGVSYSVTVMNLKDCAGNLIQPDFNKVTFGMSEDTDSLDVLINEILFNPRPTGVDFVEIFNNSSKFINLKGWSIANPDNEGASIITDSDLIFEPGQYLAITSNTSVLEGEYIQDQKGYFLQVKKLPTFNDDIGSVAVLDEEGNVVDFVRYSKEMHSVFIKDEEGVSLERISNSASSLPAGQVGESQNWASASASVGFATPGRINSNTIPFVPSEEPLVVVPEIFNPLSGHPNFALIHYNFEKGGYVANVKIFDSHGRGVREIANNDILGTRGFYRWDGDRDDGTKASVGSYMIWFEIFNDEGTVKRYLQRIAVASSFK